MAFALEAIQQSQYFPDAEKDILFMLTPCHVMDLWVYGSVAMSTSYLVEYFLCLVSNSRIQGVECSG